MRLCVGVDGGQSSTLAVVGDERGNILGRGVGPPADLVGCERGDQRQAEAIDTAIIAAMRDAGLPENTLLAAVVCGLSGYEEGEATPHLSVRARSVRVVHDTEIALVGALGDAPGAVVIAGTGSVALGMDAEGKRARAGGWGFLFGDEGSAFWIARSALSATMAREDHGEITPLARCALTFFERPTLRAIQLSYAHGEISRARLAAFAAAVLAEAQTGDAQARALRLQAAGALAEAAHCVALRLEYPENPPISRPSHQKSRSRGSSSDVSKSDFESERFRFSYAGGLFADVVLRASWRAALLERLPDAVLMDPLGEPAAGALRLAAKETG